MALLTEEKGKDKKHLPVENGQDRRCRKTKRTATRKPSRCLAVDWRNCHRGKQQHGRDRETTAGGRRPLPVAGNGTRIAGLNLHGSRDGGRRTQEDLPAGAPGLFAGDRWDVGRESQWPEVGTGVMTAAARVSCVSS